MNPSSATSSTSHQDIDTLFLLGEGRLAQRLARVGLIKANRLRVGRAAVASVLLSWVPLVLLAAVQGLAWGHEVSVPLLRDFLPYGRFWVAVPVLILGEVVVARQLGAVVAELRRSPILTPEETATFDALLARAVERWRGRGLNVLLLVLTYAVTLLALPGARRTLPGGWIEVGGRVSLAGWWYILVSTPLLRFLSFRWFWRLLLWTWVLWRMARLRLELQATHPDRAGGLAFLGGAQASFAVVAFAMSAQFSCLMANTAAHRGIGIALLQQEVLLAVGLAVFLLLLPLLVFAPKLLRAREEALVFLTGSCYQGAQDLDEKLRRERTGGLPGGEISALSDLGVLYENARLMRPLPMERRHLVSLVLGVGLPYLPLAFWVMPAREVLQKLAGLLL